MYVYMDMFFNSPQDVPDFGSITMYFVGTKELGYVEEGHKRFRKYAFQSTDLSKLSLITNAMDGSEAFSVDTGITYVLYNGQWSIKSSEITPTKMAEMLGNITQIDYQVVNQLPQTGIKGTIYLVAHSHGDRDIYDEYIWTKDNDNNNIYEKIGNTDIDLTNYVSKNEIQILSQYEYDNIPPMEKNNNEIYITTQGIYRKNNILYKAPISIPSGNIDFNNQNFLPLQGENPIQYYYTTGTNNILTNGPNNLFGSFLLKVQKFYEDSHYWEYVQTIIKTNAIYRRIIHQTSYAGSISSSYDNWQKVYPIENTTYTLSQDQNNGHIIIFTPSTGNPTTITIPDIDTTYNAATQNANGLMTAADKTKLDGININNYSMKSDTVICTEDEYNSLETKTAQFYYIIQED